LANRLRDASFGVQYRYFDRWSGQNELLFANLFSTISVNLVIIKNLKPLVNCTPSLSLIRPFDDAVWQNLGWITPTERELLYFCPTSKKLWLFDVVGFDLEHGNYV
jgi:hypothetical protein